MRRYARSACDAYIRVAVDGELVRAHRALRLPVAAACGVDSVIAGDDVNFPAADIDGKSLQPLVALRNADGSAQQGQRRVGVEAVVARSDIKRAAADRYIPVCMHGVVLRVDCKRTAGNRNAYARFQPFIAVGFVCGCVGLHGLGRILHRRRLYKPRRVRLTHTAVRGVMPSDGNPPASARPFQRRFP